MVRPRKDRLVAFEPDVSYFKPRGIPMIELAEVCLTVDEREAIRLADQLGLSQEEAGRRMGVSRATFGRIIQRARRTVADALISGKAIRIDGGNYRIVMDGRRFQCAACGHQWDEPYGTGRPSQCPGCAGENFFRTAPLAPAPTRATGKRRDAQRRS
ncbi:MAG: DUF134 domain-containing protein [Desulfobacteraceae bacterium]|jgi:predicted DNA-binding protein (UPF0251 family)|nr:DUF134 domain-containing protein [Desulfobacteraceae bacterium]